MQQQERDRVRVFRLVIDDMELFSTVSPRGGGGVSVLREGESTRLASIPTVMECGPTSCSRPPDWTLTM